MTKAPLMIDLDRLDKNIITELQKDGRITNAELAERINLSASACHRRVRRLEETGVIAGYAMIIDQEKVGLPGNVFVEISLARQTEEALDRFETAVRSCPEVLECHLMAGDSDYLLRVAVADAAAYEKIHRTVLSCLPEVSRIRSIFTLRTISDKPSVSLPG